MKNLLGMTAAVVLVLGSGPAFAKGGVQSLPKIWKVDVEADVPKNAVVGGDACTRVTATVHDLDKPYANPAMHEQPESGRERLSGGGSYADPKELQNWVEFRVRETCGTKKWAQTWAKTRLSKNYNFAISLTCPGWRMNQNNVTPTAAGAAPMPGSYLSLDDYNYVMTPKSVEVRVWDAKDYEGQAKGTRVCPK
jgi:hypothetical protein